jgi:hypothetical protein
VNVSGRKEELAAVPVSTDSAKIASAKSFIFICASFRYELPYLTKISV